MAAVAERARAAAALRRSRLAGVELGGTNANLVLGTPREIVERCRLEVTDGADTLKHIADQFQKWRSQKPIEALGIASFGHCSSTAVRPIMAMSSLR